MFHIDRLMRLSPVIPVLVVDDPAKAQPMARELLKRGCRLLEVTLRTPAALEVIAEMAKVEGVVVGAGTVLNPKDLENSLAVGAKFIVAPGLTERLSHAAIESGIAYLPGVANAGDIMRGLDLGLTHFKFFPAMASGGIPALKALAGPFAMARFCPTGGITQAAVPDWLALESVLCVGGSWVAEGL